MHTQMAREPTPYNYTTCIHKLQDNELNVFHRHTECARQPTLYVHIPHVCIHKRQENELNVFRIPKLQENDLHVSACIPHTYTDCLRTNSMYSPCAHRLTDIFDCMEYCPVSAPRNTRSARGEPNDCIDHRNTLPECFQMVMWFV